MSIEKLRCTFKAKRTKIGIVTNYRNINFGSVLQAYAMQMAVKKIGYNCEHIQCIFSLRTNYRFRRTIKEKFPFAGRIKLLFGTEIDRSRSIREKKFEVFVKENITESEKIYTTDKLSLTNSIYNVFICGSDQIWAPNQFNGAYYLGFVPDKYRKIAYAPSIGLPKIPDELKDRIAELISDIGFVSIREQEGAKIVRELTGIDAPVVLDPTLLISKEEWIVKVDKSKIPVEPYILCLFLGENPEHRKAAETYSQAKGYKIVVLPFRKDDYQWGDTIMKDAGPVDFIDLVDNAANVFTDSFHGAAFAINFNKPFCVFMRFSEDHPLCQNSRIRNLLQIFGLQDCLFYDDVSVDNMGKTINYENVNDILNKERQRSLNYLKDSLEGSLNTTENSHA